MGLFKSMAEENLDHMLSELENNMSNNYKDAAQENFKEFCEALEEYETEGKVKGHSLKKYKETMERLSEKMQGYSHKDQKPYWTK